MSASGSAYPDSVDRLIDEFASLPGIGRRSAERLAFFLLKASTDEAMGLARAIEDVKNNVGHCSICWNLTDSDPCQLCTDQQRDHSRVLVVEQPRDLIALEQTGMYRGGYHVLLGRLDPLSGVGEDTITLDALIDRVQDPARNATGSPVEEVILGLNPDMEGDSTALLVAERLEALGIQVTRLARGLPSGSQIEYANPAVLADAIHGRSSVSDPPATPTQRPGG
ncbi:MAG: recombination mediator RecR [Planctomycetota bacterium]|nr:recombination mediator RecR [Planctomycetota bacterium]MEC8818496.1 recombination mediator RecR [Planctomycetota bacterium]MED5506304.1 recombination mediator RecR [Planctomycetota bacterium]